MEYPNNEETRYCYPSHFPIGGSIFFPTIEDYFPQTDSLSCSGVILPCENRTELTDRVYE